MNFLIKIIQKLKGKSCLGDDDSALMKQSILEGLHSYNYILDEYGDPYFEKEYVRFLLANGNLMEAFIFASCDGKYSIPKYPVLFARYHEQRSQYKKAAYFYMLQSNFSWKRQSSKALLSKSCDNYALWLKENSIT